MSTPPSLLTCEKPQQAAVESSETNKQKRTSAPESNARSYHVRRFHVKPDGRDGAPAYDRGMSRRLSRRDKVTLALLGFFCAIAATIELYFVVAHRGLVAAAAHNPLAWLLSLYGPSDRDYFAAPSSLALSLEGLNVFVTQPLGLLLAWGIVRHRTWRWPLQLAVGSYLAYSVVLYFLNAQVSGFAGMSARTFRTFAVFYAANLPWLVGYAWMAWDAAREIRARLGAPARLSPALVERDRVAAVVEEVGEEPAEVEAGRQRGDDGERAEPLAP